MSNVADTLILVDLVTYAIRSVLNFCFGFIRCNINIDNKLPSNPNIPTINIDIPSIQYLTDVLVPL